MPVYEYECKNCQQIFEVQQKIADDPLTACPRCHGTVRKLMSMTSFQLKGGGWYADGYASAAGKSSNHETDKPAAPPCQTGNAGAGCAGCPAAATGK
ncbi:MAG: zinc ribbon domain-containing protein [Desulfofustis sp.]|jgi:putative FmdB family regulatory protein|nr:zinc ribbon domain-containing protein [Desulfofustis sp.]